MNTDRDTSKNTAETPVAPTKIADRELIVVTAPGDPGSGSDIRVVAMEPSPGGSGKTGRKRYLL